MRPPILQLDTLHMTRGDFSLQIDHWQVEPGRVVGLVGPNGAGKTTLLELLHGWYPPTSGTLNVLGYEPWANPVEVRNRVGILSPLYSFMGMSVAQLFQILPGYYPDHWDTTLAAELFQRLQIDPNWQVGRTSKGQGIAVQLAVAMAFSPQVLLLDEPLDGLDLAHRHRLFEIVLEVIQDTSRSVVISSHSLSDLERICDDLLVLRDGKVLAAGALNDLVGDDRSLEEAMLAWGQTP